MKLEFKWSYIYELDHHPNEFNSKEIEKQVKDFINSLEKDWKKLETNLISYMQEITNLKFKSDKINCYVIHTSERFPISDPLTIAINLKAGDEIFTLSKERYLDMLIHEIIHNILIENEKETEKYFNKLFSGMYSDNWNISLHVLVHAIHKEIYDKFFDKERFQEELEACSFHEEYKKAWDIVLEQGSQKILKEFKDSP